MRKAASRTASYTILCIWLDVGTIWLQFWIQQKELLFGELKLVAQLPASTTSNLFTRLKAPSATINISRLDVFMQVYDHWSGWDSIAWNICDSALLHHLSWFRPCNRFAFTCGLRDDGRE